MEKQMLEGKAAIVTGASYGRRSFRQKAVFPSQKKERPLC